jgi:hypothetical protein
MREARTHLISLIVALPSRCDQGGGLYVRGVATTSVGDTCQDQATWEERTACWRDGRWLMPGYSFVTVSRDIEPVPDIEVDNITAIRVDGVWIEVEPGSVSPHQFTVDPSAVAGAGIGFRAMDTPITSRNKEATYVLVSAITGVRTRQDAPGNLRA